MAAEQEGCGDRGALATAAAVVLDPRLAEIWQFVWGHLGPGEEPGDDLMTLETLGGLLRLAYLQGYADAAAEPVPGSLFAELGIRIPGSVSSRTASKHRRGPGRAASGNSDR